MDLTLLERLRTEGKLVELRRDLIDESSLRGFLYSVSTEYVVLSRVGEQMNFDGVSILQIEDITFLRWGSRKLETRTRVLSESPSSPEAASYIELTSWESILRSVAEHEKVLSFYVEKVDEVNFYVGTVTAIREDVVEAREITQEGYDGHFAVRFADLTRIDFASGYEHALLRLL